MVDQQKLVERLKAKDSTALAEVFEAHADKVYRLAVSILHDEQQADGVVQDTFLRLIKSIEGFEGRASIASWLYRVAFNECMGRIRRHRSDLSVDDLLEGEFMPGNFVNWDEVPDAVLHGNEARHQLEAAIDQLPAILKVVFTLRDIEGLSTRETAFALNISEAAVKARLHRARLQLRENLADYFREWIHS